MKKLFYSLILCGLALVTTQLQAATDGVISADEPVNQTNLIKNPSFENGFTNWTQSNMQTQTNTSFTLKHGNTYVEKWTSGGSKVGNAEVYQTLSKLPAGQYRLQAEAQNIQQDHPTTKQSGAVIYAGTTRITVTLPDTYSVEFTTLGESFNVGFRASNASGNWLCVDHFQLFYLGADAEQMLALLQTQITAAEKVLTTATRTTPALMQQSYQDTLTKAIEDAKALDANASAEEFGTVAMALDEAKTKGNDNYTAMNALKTLANKAKTYTTDTRKMAAAYKQALIDAYAAAEAVLALESDADPEETANALQAAYDAAVASCTAYTALNKSLTTAGNLDTTDKEGSEDLEAAIIAATQVLNNDQATPEEMNAATEALETAILIFRVANGTGTPISVRTDAVVQGATEIFGRATFGSGSSKEKGFCYSSESVEPTIYDNKSTQYYSNNGNIYVIHDLQPATVYYVRAYVISNSYRVSYGNVVKVYTRPLGNATYSYGYEGDDATDARILSACEEGVWMWNNIAGIQKFHLDAHYVYGAGAGDGTADCSYGGYMRISQNSAYQRTGTILHEGSHGLGVISYTDWVNSMYRTNGDRGDWLGPRVDRVIQFLENDASAKLHGDNIHMWPYGINGANEDTGSPILYRGNALIVGALAEDAIKTPNWDFMRPAYSFAQDDEAKYYIKSANTATGLKSAYLVVTDAGLLRWEEMTADEAFSNDSCTWYITFDPATCYYQLQNVGSGQIMTYSKSGTNGFRMNAKATANSRFHLLAARAKTTIDNFTFNTLAYWLVTPNGQTSLNAANNGTTSAVSFNHSDASSAQRWLLLTADEVARFGAAMGETVGIRQPKTLPHSTANLNVIGGQGCIGITAVGAGQDVVIYTLDGRQLSHQYVQRDASVTVKLPRGIYLVNSQKVTVR